MGKERTIPLMEAAALAYQDVLCTRLAEKPTPSVDELDLVALALSARLPIYYASLAGSELTRIPEAALMAGMFWGGGNRFELGDGGAVLTGLRVHKDDLERVLDELKRGASEPGC